MSGAKSTIACPTYSAACTWGALLCAIGAMVLYAHFSSHFIADDYDHFIQAASLPLLELASTPIDIHYVPLHKLFSALLVYVAPLNYDFALLVLASFHLAACLTLYKLLKTTTHSRYSLTITFLYGSSPLTLDLLMWWSSGIHRLPYIFLSLLCLYSYTLYRNRGKVLHLLLCTLSFITALGFYSKALLIPVYILALECCLPPRQTKATLLRFSTGLALLGLAALYILWYVKFSPVQKPSANINILVAFEITWLNVKVLLGNLLLQKYEAPLTVSLTVGLAFLLGTLYAAKAKPKLAIPACAALTCILLNFMMIALSSRAQMFGGFIAFALRYYLEVLFLLAVFGGIFIAQLTRNDPESPQGPTVAVSALATLYGAASIIYGGLHRNEIYEDSHLATSAYMRTLLGDLDKNIADQQLQLEAENFPLFVYGAFINQPMPIAKVLPLRYPNIEFVPSDHNGIIIDDQGHLAGLK